MTCKSLLLFLFVLGAKTGFSQYALEHDIADIAKISFVSPGISYEKRVGKFQSLSAGAFIQTSGYLGYSSSFGTTSHLYLDPTLALQYRYYYNAARRQERGKRTAYNSLNYIGPVFKVVFGAEGSSRSLQTIGAVWGLQRNYPKRFSLGFHMGPGYLFGRKMVYSDRRYESVISGFTVITQLNLGFRLN